MNVAYLTYEYDNNPLGIPSDYPSQVIELGDSEDSPGDNWVVCTLDEYNAYLASVQTDYATWLAANPGPGTPVMSQNYQVNVYSIVGRLGSTTYYANKVSLGVYTMKARDIIYTYDSTGQNILYSVDSSYDTNGNVISSVTNTYSSNTTQVILETTHT